jgi:hypothetical protein
MRRAKSRWCEMAMTYQRIRGGLMVRVERFGGGAWKENGGVAKNLH